MVVAFTSAGKGEENDYLLFFSIELPPSKPPENVAYKQLNLSSFNITWIPLTLFDARGFPEYRVVLTPLNTNSRRKRESNSIITTNSFGIFSDIKENELYSIVVGVRTGNSSEFVEGNPINGTLLYISCSYALSHTNFHFYKIYMYIYRVVYIIVYACTYTIIVPLQCRRVHLYVKMEYPYYSVFIQTFLLCACTSVHTVTCLYYVPYVASTIIIPTRGIGVDDDDCTCNCTVFIALFAFSIVVIIVLVIVVIYLIVKVKKIASYSLSKA